MNTEKITFIKRILSHFFPYTIEKRNGEIDQSLEISFVNGHYVLNSKDVNYSYGGLHKAFQYTFRKLDIRSFNPKFTLVLGFGAGSVGSILLDEYELPGKLVGVEEDGTVIELGKKYFRIRNSRNLKVVKKDAYDFVRQEKKPYHLIIVDVYINNEVPFRFESRDFLNRCIRLLKPEGMLIFNKLVYDKKTRNEAYTIQETLEQLTGNAGIIKTKGSPSNYMVFARNEKT